MIYPLIIGLSLLVAMLVSGFDVGISIAAFFAWKGRQRGIALVFAVFIIPWTIIAIALWRIFFEVISR